MAIHLTEIDNPGAGHCGFYALAIGLMEKVCLKNQVDILQHWRELDPDVGGALDAFLTQAQGKPIVDFTKYCTKAHLDPLKNSLKKILKTQILTEVASYQQRPITQNTQDYFARKLSELLENLDSRAVLRINPIADDQDISDYCRTIKALKDSIAHPYIQDMIKYALLNWLTQKCQSNFIEQINQKYDSKTPWFATDEELKLLAEIFHVEVHVFRNGQIVPGRIPEAPIFINNRSNVHWTTIVYPVGANFNRINSRHKEVIENNAAEIVVGNIESVSAKRARDADQLSAIVCHDITLGVLYDMNVLLLEQLLVLETTPLEGYELRKQELTLKRDIIEAFIFFYEKFNDLKRDAALYPPELYDILHTHFKAQLEFHYQKFLLLQASPIPNLELNTILDRVREDQARFSEALVRYYEPQLKKTSAFSLFGSLFSSPLPLKPTVRAQIPKPPAPKVTSNPITPVPAPEVTSNSINPAQIPEAEGAPINQLVQIKTAKQSNYSKYCLLGGMTAGAIIAEACIQLIPNFINTVAAGLMTSAIGAHLLLMVAFILVGLILGRIAQHLLESNQTIAPVSP